MDIQKQIIEKFRNYLQQLGYGKTTVNMLPNCVLEFLQYNNITEVLQVNCEQINGFYEHLQTRKHQRKNTGLSQTFIHHNIYSLKVFFNWLEETKQIKINPISNLSFKKPKANTREPLSQDEILQLFEATASKKEIAILHLFYSCGLRRTEAENINTADIHFTQNLVYIRAGKGAKRRAIPITTKVKNELLAYENTKNENPKYKKCEAFILNENGNRMLGNNYNLALKAILLRTDFYNYQINQSSNYQISLHHLRHSIATHLLQNGLSLEYVRDFLGHTHLEATQIYTKIYQLKLKE
jgi:integrase/recombinase XerD